MLSRWYGKGIGKELSEFSHLLDTADQTRTVDEDCITIIFFKLKRTIIFFFFKLENQSLCNCDTKNMAWL